MSFLDSTFSSMFASNLPLCNFSPIIFDMSNFYKEMDLNEPHGR